MTDVSTIARPMRSTAPVRYTVALARDEAVVRAARRLRHDVFAGEMGALLTSAEPGLDADPFDAYCDHLLVRDADTGQVVGTYRLLPPERAAVAGRLYSESEFDLTPLDGIRPGLVEAGRARRCAPAPMPTAGHWYGPPRRGPRPTGRRQCGRRRRTGERKLSICPFPVQWGGDSEARSRLEGRAMP